jgi:hypothetical protein
MISQDGMNKERYLNRQVEYIRDTDASDTHEVIIKMKTSGPDDPELYRTVAEAMRRRGLATSARDVLPVAQHVLGSQGSRGAAARALRAEDKSLAATVAQAHITEFGIDVLKAAGLPALEPLLKSDIVQQGIAGLLDTPQGRRRRKPTEASQPTSLWTASSARSAIRSKRRHAF